MPTAIPVLPSSSFDETAAFYARLGFVERARYPGEYLIVAHPAGLELHFFAEPTLDPTTNHAGCYVRFGTAAEAQALYDRWVGSGLGGQLRPPEDADYGLREFALFDPDRNLLRVGGHIEATG